MFSLEECIGAVSDGLREYKQCLVVFLLPTFTDHTEIVELLAHRKPESAVLCSQLDVWYDRA